ncbi:hypothetical protein AHIS1636_09540 [Arthrobacter mangrovi]|uniref:Uncharacterized protein n=1 Tax=Arthrobacter mangrovi TaxID=2966350 RepID=A0ABQ5MR87_9MICC|nr:hypothetical protein AHIS1636_09540 [Arthrobacter mangrovi]
MCSREEVAQRWTAALARIGCMSLRRRISRDITTGVDRSAAEGGFALDPAQRAVRDRLLLMRDAAPM